MAYENDPHYNQIFDYLSAPEMPTDADPTIIFGRNDPLVAHAAGELITEGLVEVGVISGGVGKDTGDLLKQGYRSEAHFLNETLRGHMGNVAMPPIHLDERATNGGENVRNSFAILGEHGYPVDSTIAVAHATSLRRLAETVRFEAVKAEIVTPRVFRVPTRYGFDPQNPVDQKEAAAEILRLADWPEKGWLLPQTDLPENLVDFARDIHGMPAPNPPSRLAGAVLGMPPQRGPASSINRLAKD